MKGIYDLRFTIGAMEGLVGERMESNQLPVDSDRGEGKWMN